MRLPNIISIQKYCIHDGDGIRTTVFFKGCLLNCWWCHNPESQSYQPQIMHNEEKCTHCQTCVSRCKQQAITFENGRIITDAEKCTMCETCIDYCINNARERTGKSYTVTQLIKEIEKDRMFYEESFGGVTLSGGEIMTQNMEYIEELAKRLKRKGYNITIDTCGYAPYENYERMLPYVDTFLYDIKLMDEEKHKKYMGKGNKLILDNLKKISDAGANIYIRIPVIGGVNADEASMNAIIAFLKDNIRVKKVNLLPYHNTGSSKYARLGVEYKGKDLFAPSPESMQKFVEKFQDSGFHDTQIGG